MVYVDLIPPKLFHTYCNNNLHFKHSYTQNSTLILNTHISIVCQYTKICISKYNVETNTNKITIHFHDIFNTTDDSHNKLSMGINEAVCTF